MLLIRVLASEILGVLWLLFPLGLVLKSAFDSLLAWEDCPLKLGPQGEHFFSVLQGYFHLFLESSTAQKVLGNNNGRTNSFQYQGDNIIIRSPRIKKLLNYRLIWSSGIGNILTRDAAAATVALYRSSGSEVQLLDWQYSTCCWQCGCGKSV